MGSRSRAELDADADISLQHCISEFNLIDKGLNLDQINLQCSACHEPVITHKTGLFHACVLRHEVLNPSDHNSAMSALHALTGLLGLMDHLGPDGESDHCFFYGSLALCERCVRAQLTALQELLT